MTITGDERAAMSDLFDEIGPDAPTLCEGWTTRDLLAHLLVRERRPDAAGGILIPALAKRTEKVQNQIAHKPYADLIEQFRGGPPVWSPWALPVLGDKANLGEFYVHHEDIRRAQPDWQPRDADKDRADALWKLLKVMGRVLFRQSSVGVVLRSANRADIVAKKNAPGVVLVGEPGEIVLYGFGRSADKVRLVIQGAPDQVSAFESASRGI
ncbi:MAG: TIGR03085 family metal-binding protein [Ilumatobacteraceae bacterium]